MKIAIKISIRSSKTSNNIEMEMPRYRDMDPPSAAIIEPVNCNRNVLEYSIITIHDYNEIK